MRRRPLGLRTRLVLAAAYILTVVVVALEVPVARTLRDSDNKRFESTILNYTALVASRINDDVANFAKPNPNPANPAVAFSK